FQKLTGGERILQRCFMCVGSTIPDDSLHFTIEDSGLYEKARVRLAPGLLNVTKEALINAADRVSAVYEPGINIDVKTTKVAIDVSGSKICVFYNGTGIPVELVEYHGVYISELVFGHMHAYSDYNDNIDRLNTGLNGLGIKLTNILSKTLCIEPLDANAGQNS
ncbi:unnamed protein product, partial [Ectocarpus sp. 13 AM-2016]